MAQTGVFDRREGRNAFGGDPQAYDAARPDYPETVFDLLTSRCGLGPGAALFEIGPGPGTATRRLVELGAASILAIEPDRRLADELRGRLAHRVSLSVVEEPFETAAAPLKVFDLGVCATAFHWLDAAVALPKIAAML